MTQSKSTDALRRHLQQLIDALDSRVPHIEREGEAQIAQQAHALKEEALRRLAELDESRPPSQA
jgi:hypothetical protein